MTASDLRLNRDQETALREADETGDWYPQNAADERIARRLEQMGLFAARTFGNGFLRLYRTGGYWITAAGRDWLALHPTEVAR